MESPNNFTAVKDSGARQSFSTGSVRDTQEGKGRYDLISPISLERLAKHYENGAKKYGDRNWEKGQPLSRYLDSTLRHINKFREGHRDEDHLCAAVWNLMCIIHTEEMIRRGKLPAALNDLVEYLSAGAETRQCDDGDTHEGTKPSPSVNVIVEKATQGGWDILSPCRRFYWQLSDSSGTSGYWSDRHVEDTSEREENGMFGPPGPNPLAIAAAQRTPIPQ